MARKGKGFRIVKRVDDALLGEIVARIREVAEPVKIVLFGSRARGEGGDRSDVDILVIVERSEEPRHRRAVLLYRALAGLLVPKDILVYTEEEVEEWSGVPQAFITTALREGKVLYERKTGPGQSMAQER